MKRLDFADARTNQPGDDIGLDVEMRLPRWPRNKEAVVSRIRFKKVLAKRGIDFIGELGNARADRCVDLFSPSSELFHGFDRRIRDSSERPPPSCVGRSDDACIGISKQHRRAVGCQNPEQESRPIGDDRVGARAVGLRPARRA